MSNDDTKKQAQDVLSPTFTYMSRKDRARLALECFALWLAEHGRALAPLAREACVLEVEKALGRVAVETTEDPETASVRDAVRELLGILTKILDSSEPLPASYFDDVAIPALARARAVLATLENGKP